MKIGRARLLATEKRPEIKKKGVMGRVIKHRPTNQAASVGQGTPASGKGDGNKGLGRFKKGVGGSRRLKGQRPRKSAQSGVPNKKKGEE